MNLKSSRTIAKAKYYQDGSLDMRITFLI